MVSTVIKPDASRDEYVYWSSVVDAPIFYGDAIAMQSHLTQNGEEGDGERITRADQTGTSAQWGNPLAYSWADGGPLIFHQDGLVMYDDLWALAQRLAGGEPVDDMLTPFEDEEDE